MIVFRAFGEDISCDEEGIHPPYICHGCVKKILKWWEKAKKRKAATCHIKLHKFESSNRGDNVKEEVAAQLDITAVTAHAASRGLMAWKGPSALLVMRMGTNGRHEVSISIHPDSTWDVTVCEMRLPAESHHLAQFPAVLTLPSAISLIDLVDSLNVCAGNSDFPDLVKAEEGDKGQTPITITGRDVYQTYPFSTIRHEMCSLLVGKPHVRCDMCKIHRGDLSSKLAKWRNSVCQRLQGPSIRTRNDRLSTSQLRAKATLLQAQKRALLRKNRIMKEKIAQMIKAEGVPLVHQQDVLLRKVFEESDCSSIESSTPASLLWKQHDESLKKGKAMRWHPAIIRFCIALRSKSSSAYNLIRESGFLQLPHPTTLHPYSHFATPASGFNSDLVLRIINDHISEEMPPHHRDVSLLFDEMKIKSGLVYSKATGNVVGVVDVGSIGNEILAFEKKCKGEKDVPIATHVLVLMIRGIFTGLHAAIGYYPSTGVSSHQLYPCLLEAIVFLENAGFVVRALVSDGASPNRKYYKMNRDEGDDSAVVHCTRSPADPSRKVFFICDGASGYNNKTRHLHVSGPHSSKLSTVDSCCNTPGSRI